ncbi:MAG: hypothetical protein JWL94_2182 [Microbacteriaceae bacterium]|jgi:hypothetical protein|nr:hypothetical protein [Microbacteriaceae bacterium]HEV7955909.1 hypothetical protein [Marisediminicola sp.]
MSPTAYAATFGDLPLNHPAVVGPRDAGAVTPSSPPTGATAEEILSHATQLRCIWRDPMADITYLAATIGTADTATGRLHLEELAASGYTCVGVHGGTRCQMVKPDETYPVDEGYTAFLRDDIYIYVGQANFATEDLLGEFVDNLWG